MSLILLYKLQMSLAGLLFPLLESIKRKHAHGTSGEGECRQKSKYLLQVLLSSSVIVCLLLQSLTVRDTVRECLEKDPSERTEDDVETLLEFTQHLKAFTNMTLAVRRALCSVMVFAVVERAGTVVMNDGEELDSWSVLINGHVEVELANGETQQLHLGDR